MPGRRLIAILLLFGALVVPTIARAAEPIAPVTPSVPSTAPAYVPGKVIVEWAPSAEHGDKVAAREEADVSYESNLGDPSFQLVGVEPGQSVAGAIEELESEPAVAVAERDSYAAPTSIPNDPLFGEQWALQNTGAGIEGFSGAVAGDDIDATDAWDRTVGTPNTVVADIDTGYRFDSPDLGPVAWTNNEGLHGWDFVGNDSEAPTEDSDPTDEDLISGGHGVHTAGIIGAAGNNGIGITGVAQDVRIMPLRVCSNAPSVNEALCPTSSIIAAINYAGENGAKIANLSLGGTESSVAELDAFAENPDTLYVIAAGNDAEDNDLVGHYPCDYEPATTGIPGATENIICVAATDQADQLASFSDWGSNSVDLGAPGTQILSTYPARETVIEDNFETDNFETRWKTPTNISGLEGGFERTDEAPLTSYGISDSPERAPVADSIRSSQLSSPVAVPAEDGSCTFSGLDSVALGGGTFNLTIFRNGVSDWIYSLPETSGAQMKNFITVPMTDLAGSNVGVRVRYTAGSSPGANSGVWLDDLKLSCNAPLSTPPTYAFLEGTSMATPMVSGAAALLYSERPGATVTEVTYALLEGVDPDPSLEGKTASGGRLDVARALDWLEPPAPVLSISPPSPARDAEPQIVGSIAAGVRAKLFMGEGCSGPYYTAGPAEQFSSGGFTVQVPAGATEVFSAFVETRYSVSPCSAPITYTNPAPPAEPILEQTDPLSPSTDEHPLIVGSSAAGSTVAIYAGEACEGPVEWTGTAAELESPGIAVTVPKNTTRIFSAIAKTTANEESSCSGLLVYDDDQEPPAAPSLTATSPVSPAADSRPRIIGEAEKWTKVKIYAGVGCAAPLPIAEGSADALASPGIEVDVAEKSTAEFSATATDEAGNTSPCSQPISYTDAPLIQPTGDKGTATILEPESTPPAPPPVTSVAAACTVPKLVGKTLAKAKAALKGANCAVGKVAEPKGQGKGALVVAGSNPAAGAKTAGAVGLRLAPEPAKRHR